MYILSYNVIPASAGVRSGAFPAAVSTSYSKGGDFMSIEQLLLMLALLRPGVVSSITVTNSTVTIRIKK